MAPGQAPHSEREKRIKNIISFAIELEGQISSTAFSSKPSLVQDVYDQISKLPNKRVPAAEASCAEIDSCGTKLWNACTRARRRFDSDNPVDLPPILVVARVFAFRLLDCAYEHGNNTFGNFTRLLKTGTKAAKNCIEAQDMDLALNVLEKLSIYEERLEKKDARISGEEVVTCAPLVAEYYILRTTVAWQKDQPKVAEHMFNKSNNITIDPHAAESLSDVLYEMGKSLLEKSEYRMAVTWLERARIMLDRHELDRLSTDASELRISILQSTIKALIGMDGPEEMARARDMVAQLELELGGKLIVLLLKLEIITASTDANFDVDTYASILRKMIRTLLMSDSNFKLILFHIRKLNEKNSRLACATLDELATLRILPEGPLERVEKVVITRLYLIRAERENQDDILPLENLLDSIAANLKESLGAAACLGAHTLLWTRIEASYTQRQLEVSERWCRLAMRAIFANSGDVNIARISRKLLLCAIERHDLNTAADIFGAMPETSSREPMTQFLMYKLALRCDDSELATNSLKNIATSTTNDPNLLYACCLEAQNHGSRSQALTALLLVLEKQSSGAPTTIHLPSLTRSAIKMLVPMIEGSKQLEGSAEIESLIDKLCLLYEKAAQAVSKEALHVKPGDTNWSTLELDWFSKNSYNIAVKHLCDWNPRNSLRMILSCIKFIDHYPKDINKQISEDLALRKMFCEFTGATALLTLARSEDNIEVQLQYYLELRKHVESFDKSLDERVENMEPVSQMDLLQKLSILLSFDFEAACQLKAWDSLGDVILKAEVCKSMRIYQLMADCLLCTQAPAAVKITTMKKIINEAWSLEELDSVRLAKYMRCLFQIAISENLEVAEQLLDQIQGQAEQAAETETPYPTEELEWIITTAFNQGIDFFCTGKDAEYKNWANKAINLAHLCPDGGIMLNSLQEKFLKMNHGS